MHETFFCLEEGLFLHFKINGYSHCFLGIMSVIKNVKEVYITYTFIIKLKKEMTTVSYLKKGFLSLVIGIGILISTLIINVSLGWYFVCIGLSMVFNVTATSLFFKHLLKMKINNIKK